MTIDSNMSNGNYASAYKAGNTYDGANSIREIESPTSNTGSLQVYSGTPTSNNDAPNYHIHVQGDFS